MPAFRKRCRPALLALEDRTTPAGMQIVAFGADVGTAPEVRVFRGDGSELTDFLAFDSPSSGGVRVAVGDVNGDGFDDLIVGAGPGGVPLVRVFDGFNLQNGGPLTVLAQFNAFETEFAGGVYVAAGRLVPTDRRSEIIVGAGAGGGPHVETFQVNADGGVVPLAGPLGSFYAYAPTFTGGVRVAAGDLDTQPGDELITGAGPGGGPHVQVFRVDGTVLASFFAYDPSFAGGVYVAAGEVDGRPVAGELITGAGAGGGPNVKVFEVAGGVTELNSFYAYDPSFSGGVRVGVGFRAADAPPLAGFHPEVVTAPGPSGGPQVEAFDATDTGLPGVVRTSSFFAFAPSFAGGVFVSV